MSVSVANANIELIIAAIEAVLSAENAVANCQTRIASADNSSSSKATNATAISDAVSKVIIATQKAALLPKAYTSLESILLSHHDTLLAHVKEKHLHLSSYANNKPMPLLSDFDIVTAKLLLGNLMCGYQKVGALSASACTLAMLSEGESSSSSWGSLSAKFSNFLALANSMSAPTATTTPASSAPTASSSIAGIPVPVNFDLDVFKTVTVPDIFKVRSTSLGSASAAFDAIYKIAEEDSVGDILARLGTTQHAKLLAAQHEPLRKELEILEYSFGVSKTRYNREQQDFSNHGGLDAVRRAATNNAVSSTVPTVSPTNNLKLAKGLMLSTGIMLADYHFRVGRYNEAFRYISAMEKEARALVDSGLDSKPIDTFTFGGLVPDRSYVPPEAFLSDYEYSLLSPARYATMIAKVAVYHTFHTDAFGPVCGKVVENTLELVSSAIYDNIAPTEGGPASGANPTHNASSAAANNDSPNERFVKAVHKYERLYAASRNSLVYKLGTPMPRYGLPDVDPSQETSGAGAADANNSNNSTTAPDGSPLPIPINRFVFEGADILEDFNLQTAFNPFCSPLFSIADYTFLIVASMYLAVHDVTITNRRRLLLEPSSFTNKAIIEDRRRKLRSAVRLLPQLRMEELTGAQYDLVKALMFGEYRDECVGLAMAIEQRQQQRSGAAVANSNNANDEDDNTSAGMLSSPTATSSATFSPSTTTCFPSVKYSLNTPILSELAKVTAVLVISTLNREDLKSQYLALPEVQVILSTENECAHELVVRQQRQWEQKHEAASNPNPYVLINPSTGKKISTSARAIVQGCLNTQYSDAMLGLGTAPNSIFTDFFATHPHFYFLIPHARQDIRESIIKRLIQPYAAISMQKMVDQLSLYSGADPVEQLQNELRMMILHGKLSSSSSDAAGGGGGKGAASSSAAGGGGGGSNSAVRINWKDKTVVRLQHAYGNTRRSRSNNTTPSSSSIYRYDRVDEAILAVAERITSDVGLAYTRATERLLRVSSIRASRLDDVKRKNNGGAAKNNNDNKGGRKNNGDNDGTIEDFCDDDEDEDPYGNVNSDKTARMLRK